MSSQHNDDNEQSEFNNGEFHDDVDIMLNYIIRTSLFRSRNNRINNIFNASMISSFYDFISDYDYENAIRISFDEHESLKRKEDSIDFKTVKYSNLDFKNFETQCSICLVNYENGDNVSLTNCNHLFHNECLVEWTHYKKECPICRKNLE